MTNINPLLSNCYKFIIDRGDSKLELFGQTVSLPGIKLSVSPQPTTLGVQIPVATNTFTFESLILEFIVDENIENWKSIYDWMSSIGNISNDTDNEMYRTWATTAYLRVLGSNYYPINKTAVFHYVIPTALSALTFRSDLGDSTPMKARVTFSYSYYDFD